LPRDEDEYLALKRAFEERHGKVVCRVVKGRKASPSAEAVFAQAWEASRDPEPMVAQHQFHPERKWRFDFAWPRHKLALEIDGVQHGLVHEMRKDNEKMAEAAIAGWRVIRVLSADKRKVQSWVELIQRALRGEQKR